MSTIVGILLAAGSSQRFGANKLTHILPDGGTCLPQPVSRHSAVLAVVRPGCEILAAQLQAEGAEVRICTNADQGMSASLIFGILTCPEATGWLIALADMPWIAPITIHKIADALRFGAPLAVPSWQGRLGHPVGFSQALGPDLLALSGDVGAKAVIQANLKLAHIIDCDDPGIFHDIEKQEDLSMAVSWKVSANLPID